MYDFELTEPRINKRLLGSIRFLTQIGVMIIREVKKFIPRRTHCCKAEKNSTNIPLLVCNL
ncbi:hypothetical protein BMETH_983_0 [methanotrophic bacterial endosymbiont of Bathymodiolus sp.]|nr:hypothetical protein BMETH_983_0 [methanotrophic bacterial endosymbiont of Bathymodiolus sp.]